MSGQGGEELRPAGSSGFADELALLAFRV